VKCIRHPNACAPKYVNKFRITNARRRVEFGFFFYLLLTGNAHKLHFILGSICVAVYATVCVRVSVC